MKFAVVVCALLSCALVSADRPVPFEEPVAVRPNRLYAKPRNADRIINGGNAGRGNYPYQISLQRLGSSWFHTCGGSILHSTAILTAAHCVDDSSVGASSYRVVAGEYDFNKNEGSEQTIGASSLRYHSSWNPSVIDNDVAIVKLKSAIKLGTYAAAITLASVDPPVGQTSTVTGWGWTNYYFQTRPNIMQVLSTKRDSTEWAEKDTQNLFNPLTQVAAYISSSQGVCKGDSGGPLVYLNNGKYTQYGVVSYGMTPCASGKTDVYARVSYFRSWINNNS